MTHRRIPLLVVAVAAVLGGCATSATPTPVSPAAPRATEVQAHYAAGKSYLLDGRPAMARDAFLRALDLDADAVEARNGLATAYLRLDQPDAALEQLRLAVAARPDAAHLHSNLGYVLAQRGRREEAQAALQRALTLDPDNPRARYNWLALQRDAERRETASASAAPVVATANEGPATHVVNLDFNRPAVGPTLTLNFGGPGPAVRPVVSGFAVPARPQFGIRPAEPTLLGRELPPAPPAARVEAVSGPQPSAAPPLPTRVSLRGPGSVPSAAALPAPSLLAPSLRVEINNGNGVNGFAFRLGVQLRVLQVPVQRVANADRFTYETTRIYFRDGRRDEALALGRLLPVHVEIIGTAPDTGATAPDLRVVVGRDLTSQAQIERIGTTAPVVTSDDVTHG